MTRNIILFSILILLLIISVIQLIFKYLITKNKIKVSKVSKLFYTDDKTFMKTWEKRKGSGKRGILMYILKDSIFLLYPAYLIWVNYSKEYRLSWFVIIGIYVILCIIALFGSPRWVAAQDKYIKLKEKEKIENDNINSTNINFKE